MNTHYLTDRTRIKLIFLILIFFLIVNINTTFASVNFDAVSHYSLGEVVPEEIVYADFDGDNDLDLATAQPYNGQVAEEGGVFIHINEGDGTFAEPTRVHFADNTISITTADFDNDNDIDVAAANNGSDDIVILLNNGNGDFTISSRLTGELVTPTNVASADFDGDSDTDIVVTVNGVGDGEAGGGAVIFNNDGNASFSRGNILFTDPEEQGVPSDVVATDLNGDSYSDIAITDVNLTIFFSEGDGTFSETQVSENYASSIVSYDTDNDGDIDLILNREGLRIIENEGNGIFNYQQTIETSIHIDAFAIADLDQDADFDVVAPSSWAEINILLQESGEFLLQTPIPLPFLFYSNPVLSADLNNDNRNDIAVISTPGSSEYGYDVILQISRSPEESTEELIDVVEDFNLPSNLDNSYLANLSKVEQFINEGKILPAIKQLNAFINKVNQDLQHNLITQEEATTLIDKASDLLDALTNS
jgi:hypothetical protein